MLISSLVGLYWWWLKLYLARNVTHNKGIWNYAKFVTNFKLHKFHVTTPHCSNSVTTWVTWVCVTVKFAAQQPLMTSELNSCGLADGCWCWPVHCGTTGLITPTTVCDSISYTGSWELPLRRAICDPCYGLAPLQRDAHVEASACRNVLVIFIKISSRKSIGNTLSILLSKSIADNTVDIWKEAAKIHRR